LIDVYDPWVDKGNLNSKINFKFITQFPKKKYDAIILAVSHSIFKKMGFKKINSVVKTNGCFYDVKSLFHGKKNVDYL